MACIQYATWLDEEYFDLVFRVGLVFHTLWHDEHLTGGNMRGAIPEIDPKLAFQHDEGLIRVFVIMPHKVALNLDDLELVVVHFRDDPWLPVFVK